MVPRAVAERAPYLDVTSAMDESPPTRAVRLRVMAEPEEPAPSDPFDEVEI